MRYAGTTKASRWAAYNPNLFSETWKEAGDVIFELASSQWQGFAEFR